MASPDQSLPIRPGWYPDPEAHDLERWWDGSAWSDTDFRPKPEPSEIARYFASYRDLSPHSPTNYLAVASLVCGSITVVTAGALVIVAFAMPAIAHRFASASMWTLLTAVVLCCSIWMAVLSARAIANARRHRGKRLVEAVLAFMLSTIAAVVLGVLLGVVLPN